MYNYESENEQLEIATEDIIFGCKSGYVNGSKCNAITSKTENSALKLIEEKKQQNRKWLEVIEATLDRFIDTEYYDLILYTYKEQYKLPKILRLMALEKSAYYDRKNDVIYYVALKAIEKGLIKV